MDYIHKKKINDKIEKITDYHIFLEIYENIKDEINKDKNITINKNGIYFDINKLSNNSILKIENILNEHLISTDTDKS
jgi:hypothetical protein